MSNGDSGYHYGSDTRLLGQYRIQFGVRRNELYEQYVAATATGVSVSLKSVGAQGNPTADRLGDLATPFSVGLLALLDFKRNEDGGNDLLIVTELAGTTLRERLSEGALSAELAFGTLHDLALTLKTLEDRGLPMPAVYPEAVCLRSDGAKLDDYYLPLLYEAQRLPDTLSLGSYSAPELDETGPGSRPTLFSLGLVMYEMLTGRHPFSGGARQVIAAILTRDADLGAVAEGARPLLQRLLARDPRERFGSAAELLAALDSSLSGGPMDLSPVTWQSPSGTDGEAAPGRESGPRFETLGRNDQGLPEFRRPGDGAVMVLVPGGTFSMGSADGSPAEQPPVNVTLEPFLIDKQLVTWEQFLSQHVGHDKTCEFCSMKAQVLPTRFNPAPRKSRDPHGLTDLEVRYGPINDAISADGGEKVPALYLTYSEMRKYAESVGAELPSEAEWELACRAGTTTRYPWGNDKDGSAAWFQDNSDGVPHPVGGRKPNPWGLYDMNGNVAEVCRDKFVKEIYEMIAGGAASVEELQDGVTRPGGRYAVRGGAYNSSETGITSSFRLGALPDLRSESRGFRCVIRKKNAPSWAAEAFGGGAGERPEGAAAEPAADPGQS